MFTATLDRLAYEYDVLFVVAAGNAGDQPQPGNRIQPPSDIVNGLGVGAYCRTPDGRVIPAGYSCIGPGRPGSCVKPDVAAFGGSKGDEFHILLAGSQGGLVGELGTSFAAPLVARLAGHLLYRVEDHSLISPQTAKALVIHGAARRGVWPTSHGWGAIDEDPLSITTCAPNEVTVLFKGEIDFTRWVRLWLPFPAELERSDDVVFEWTISYSCDVCSASPDDYTLAGKELRFRPNADLFNFSTKKNGKTRRKRLDVGVYGEEARVLVANGWRRSSVPVSSPYKREQELREEGKWDTVSRGIARVSPKDRIYRPALDFHAIARADWETSGPGALSYAAAVTIQSEDPSLELYQRVREVAPQLVDVRLRERARRRAKA